MRKKIIVWHGEGKSLFYVVEYNPEDSSDYSILATFSCRENAEEYLFEVA